MKNKTLQAIYCRKTIKKHLIELAHAVIVALIIGLPFAAYFAFLMEQ